MESSSFSHSELVTLDFAGAYRALWHDAGVLGSFWLVPGYLLPPPPKLPPARETGGHSCAPLTGREKPGCA